MSIILNSQPQKGKTTQYRLSIQADLNGFSFSVIEPTREEPLYLYHAPLTMEQGKMEQFSAEVKALIKAQPLLRSSYSEVSLYYSTPKFITVPTPIYKKENDLTYLETLYQLEELDHIESIEVESQEMVIVYPLYSTLNHILKEHQPELKSYPTLYKFIERLLTYPEHNKVLFQYFKGLLYVVLVRGERVVHAAAYPAHHFTTALYFLLLSTQEAQFNLEQTTIYVSGNLGVGELEQLSNYFSKVNYFKNPQHPLPTADMQLKFGVIT